MIYPGGEVAFLRKLIDESLVLRQRVQWYSSMVGKLESLKELLVTLKEKSITNTAIKELIQGHKTRRWALAWSFHPIRPPLTTSRGISASSGIPKQLLPFPSEFTFFSKSGTKLTGHALRQHLKSLSLSTTSTSNWSSTVTTIGFTAGNTWSRASRRQKPREGKTRDTETISKEGERESKTETDSKPVATFGFKVTMIPKFANDDEEEGVEEGMEVVVRWMKGFDSVLFESFCGMVRRVVEELGSGNT